MQNERFIASSEPVVELYVKSWHPKETPKATVTYVHGIGEHIKRYEPIFQHFQENGIQVTAFDQRGFGETGVKSQQRGQCMGMDVLIEDLKIVDATARIEGIPHFVYGHSMGGLTALTFVHRYPEGIAGIISSAPALLPGKDVLPNYVVRNILLKASQMFPQKVIPNLVDTTTLTRDPEVLNVYKKDPLNYGFATMQTLSEVLLYGKHMRRTHVKSFKTPILVAHGADDRITCFDTSKKFVEDLTVEDKEFVAFEGYYHELHNEPDDLKKPVFDLYTNWILQRAQ